MKNIYVSDIRGYRNNQSIRRALLAVTRIEIRKTGEEVPQSYLSIRFGDNSGKIAGTCFGYDTLPDHVKEDSLVLVSGRYSREFRNIHIQDPGQIEEYRGDYERDDFLAKSPRDIDEMNAELTNIIRSIKEPNYRRLLGRIFRDEKVRKRFREWPAAESIHQPYIGGLLEHSLGVAKSAGWFAELYDADRDLSFTGGLVHDLGKLEELNLGLVTISYTEKARKYGGHIILGANFVRDRMGIKFPEDLRDKLLHIILSHHGTKEQGAITLPLIPEARFVYYADMIDVNEYKTRRGQKIELLKETFEVGLPKDELPF